MKTQETNTIERTRKENTAPAPRACLRRLRVRRRTIAVLSVSAATADLPGIRQALAATRHLREMYRRQLYDDKTRRRLQRLDRRLLDIAQQLQRVAVSAVLTVGFFP